MNYPRQVLLAVGILGFCYSGLAQTSESQKRLYDYMQERADLRSEFVQLFKQHRQSPPEVREAAVSAWNAAHKAEINALDAKVERERALTKNEHVPTPLKSPVRKRVTPKEQEYFSISDQLWQSKRKTLARIGSLSPQQREQTMIAWQRQNASSLQKANDLAEKIRSERAAKNLTREGEDKVLVPAMPEEFSDANLADWDELWILRHRKGETFKQHKASSGEVRKSAMDRWNALYGKRLAELELNFLRK